MPFSEPKVKRTVAFIDGQNLFYAAKEAFGYTFPNYSFPALAAEVCKSQGWKLEEVRFYTGIPEHSDNPGRNLFWSAKLAAMGKRGVHIFTRHLRYRNKTVRLQNGSEHTFLVGQEKGVDIRLALDVVRRASEKIYDVALVFSQDQDLSEVADELRRISSYQGRWLKIASAYPFSPTTRNRRGINGTDWIKIARTMYDACIDKTDYRPKPKTTPSSSPPRRSKASTTIRRSRPHP